jgi:PAS domain S-box-containing protein
MSTAAAPATADLAPPAAASVPTADQLYDRARHAVFVRTDRLFAGLMAFQFVGGIVAAIVLSRSTYAGTHAHLHPHVVAALLLGALINFPPIVLAFLLPGRPVTRYVISTCQALSSALLIHLSGGRIETHFHVFGSLAFLAFYRDWRVLIPATVVTAVDHFVRGVYLPQSVFGVLVASPWRPVEHAAWVIFEDIFLIGSCVANAREMRAAAAQTAETARKNAELAAIRDTALDCVIGMDHLGRITEFNPAAERTFGHRRADVLGRTLSDVIVPPSLRDAHNKGLERYLRTGEGPVLGKRVEVPSIRADGTEFPVELAITAVHLDGPPIFVAYLRDITDRKQAEEQAKLSEKLALVASRTDNAVIITDPQGRIEWVNDGFTRVTGYAPDEVVGRKPGSFLQGPETDPATVDRIRRHLARGEGFTAEIVNYGKTGRKYWLAIEVQPIRDESGALRHFMAIESDVTGRKDAEAALHHAKEDADRARETAEAASVAKSQFLANMSHEIRTPLNGVIGMAELLIRKGGLTEQQLRYASVIKSSGDSLLSLINDVLDFSKIEAGKLELSPIEFDLRSAVEDVVEMLSPKAAAKNLAFACQVPSAAPARVTGDPDRVRQVLINLVNNAVKFTETGEVVIHADVADRDARHVTMKFSVRDTGPGIPPDRLDRLFKSFSQVDASTTRKYGGTGLGLAIVKQLAELMGGTVGVESAPGQGSTFWFTARFGLAARTADDHARTATLAGALRGLRVLAVDDQPTYLEVLREQLAPWGFDLHTCTSGERAVEMIRDAAAAGAPYRLAIVDMIMPGTDGPAVARAVTADPRLPRETSLVLLTAMDNPFDPDAMKEIGFAACLTKPVRHSTLFDTIADVLARKAQPAVTGATPSQGDGEPSGIGAHVLLAEDNEVNQEVAREILTDAGCTVEVVGNGAAAVAACADAAKRFDIILMDCQMPVMDGFEATRRIRQTDRGVKLPILALTANAVAGDRERCLAAGMSDYVSKPIDPDVLLATVRRLLAPATSQPTTPSPAAASPTTPPAPAPSSAPIDTPALLKRCRGKAELANRLLNTFAASVDTQLAELRATLDGANWEVFTRVAHTIKGASANLAAEPVRAAAADLEQLGKAADAGGAEAALARLEAELRECVAYIPRALPAAEGETKTNMAVGAVNQ